MFTPFGVLYLSLWVSWVGLMVVGIGRHLLYIDPTNEDYAMPGTVLILTGGLVLVIGVIVSAISLDRALTVAAKLLNWGV